MPFWHSWQRRRDEGAAKVRRVCRCGTQGKTGIREAIQEAMR